MTKEKKRAVVYVRARCIGGSDDGVDAQLAQQRAACTRVAEQHGAAVIHEYEAIGGARDVHVRAIVRDMLDQVAEARADYIITIGFDRLCRGPANADRELLHAIRTSGAALLCGSTWDVYVPSGLSDDVLAEVHTAILSGRSA
jgi:DNA invertase Pin-like site-specific DNA recombinase